MALGFLLLGVQVTLSIVVLCVFFCCLEGLGVISTKNAYESYIVNLPTGFFCIFDQIIVGASLEFGLFARGVSENPSFNDNKTETIILAVPLIFTNFTATALIGFKAWHHFQSIQKNLGSTNGSPKSGLLYLAFWIGYLVLGLTQDGGTTANQAIYPILIILAVAHENNKPENVNNMSLSQSIRFASVQASKSKVHHSESGGESQLAFSSARIDSSTEVEGIGIDILLCSG
ncbi:hypothetical protein K435DRAFT_807714 [Dendrothele bispora CBS 962.96]|uniref:Uncharacterized protein n=1 Tax=Dendrothele bispora (strain CBS 962.96) TaxID=1314807 RepID=A0A4S8L3W6_DENBC|nr:hypothetical protein K435DRAFT_807714 [Dendrothele bispora CBS 962.96]